MSYIYNFNNFNNIYYENVRILNLDQFKNSLHIKNNTYKLPR